MYFFSVDDCSGTIPVYIWSVPPACAPNSLDVASLGPNLAAKFSKHFNTSAEDEAIFKLGDLVAVQGKIKDIHGDRALAATSYRNFISYRVVSKLRQSCKFVVRFDRKARQRFV